MIVYPASLPPPVREEYNLTLSHKSRRIVMEDGFVRPQKLVTAPQYTRMLRWNLRSAQVPIFRDWWARLGGEEAEVPLESGVTAVITVTTAPTFEPAPSGMVARLQVQEIKSPSNLIVGYPEWPAALPMFNMQGASFAYGTRFEMAEGDLFVPLARQRFSSVPGKLTGTLTLNRQERDAFWQFYEGIGLGTRYFRMPLFDGVTERVVRAWIMDDPREVANGPGFDVSTSIGYNATSIVKPGS